MCENRSLTFDTIVFISFCDFLPAFGHKLSHPPDMPRRSSEKLLATREWLKYKSILLGNVIAMLKKIDTTNRVAA